MCTIITYIFEECGDPDSDAAALCEAAEERRGVVCSVGSRYRLYRDVPLTGKCLECEI
jgi:hypothetical protein